MVRDTLMQARTVLYEAVQRTLARSKEIATNMTIRTTTAIVNSGPDSIQLPLAPLTERLTANGQAYFVFCFAVSAAHLVICKTFGNEELTKMTRLAASDTDPQVSFKKTTAKKRPQTGIVQ